MSLESIYIHDVLWKFDHLPSNYTKVAFIAGEEAPEEMGPTLIHLKRRAYVIDALAPSAAEEVRKVFGSIAP